jgi:hypothetical protein
MNTPSLLKVGGWAVAVLATVFLAHKMFTYKSVLFSWSPSLMELAIVFVYALIYGIGGLLLAMAWLAFLKLHQNKKVAPQIGLKIYARTSIAKYLPGNVFHYVGRQASGAVHEYLQISLFVASFYEIVSILAVSCILILFSLQFSSFRPDFFSVHLALASIVLCSAVPWGINMMAPKVSALKKRLPHRISLRLLSGQVLFAYLCYFIFFCMLGLLLHGIFILLAPPGAEVSLGTSLLISCLSWLAGCVTPGAPAGMGVREAVIVAGLTHEIGGGQAVLAALLLRFITTVGDFVFFLLSFLFHSTRS